MSYRDDPRAMIKEMKRRGWPLMITKTDNRGRSMNGWQIPYTGRNHGSRFPPRVGNLYYTFMSEDGDFYEITHHFDPNDSENGVTFSRLTLSKEKIQSHLYFLDRVD